MKTIHLDIHDIPRNAQGTLETAICIPIMLLIFFAIVEFGWVVFCESSLNTAISESEWSVSSADITSTIDYDSLIANEIIESSGVLNAKYLTVSDADISFSTSTESRTLSDEDKYDYSVGQVSQTIKTVTIKATVTYSFPLLFPEPLNQITYSRSVDKVQTVASTFEVD
jgi:Flp pilus assembly protein TadG